MSKQAIPGKRGNLFSVDPTFPQIVGIDTKHKTSKEHPLYDPRIKLPVDEALVRNIMVYGVIDPVKVCKDGTDVLVVDGRQRVRAAREANKRLKKEGKEELTVPLVLKRGTDATLFGVMVSANENRQDDGPLTKADKAGRMLDMGKTVEEIAIAFGVTVQAVNNWLALLDVGTDVRNAVEKGAITASAAAKLSSLPREEQSKELKEIVASGKGATVAEVAARVRTRKNGANGEVHNVAPGKKAILKLVKHLKTLDEEYLSEDFIKGLRVACGDLSTATIANLTALFEESKDVKLTDPKPKKTKGKSKRASKAKAPPRVSK